MAKSKRVFPLDMLDMLKPLSVSKLVCLVFLTICNSKWGVLLQINQKSNVDKTTLFSFVPSLLKQEVQQI